MSGEWIRDSKRLCRPQMNGAQASKSFYNGPKAANGFMAPMKDNQVIAGDFYDDTELHNKRYISYCPSAHSVARQKATTEFNKLQCLVPKSLHLARQCRRCVLAITLPPVGLLRHFQFSIPFPWLVRFPCHHIEIDAQHASQ